jgi:hypothetical protein
MRTTTWARIVRGAISNVDSTGRLRGVRELVRHIPTSNRRARAFARYVIRDSVRYLGNTPKPIEGETLRRAQLAAEWLARAQDATDDGGFSHGYFPFRCTSGWRESYPETTGYTIPTLLAYAAALDEPAFCARAIRMALFLTRCQMPSGAVCGGVARAPQRIPVAFDTGMVLLGLLAAYRHTRVAAFAECAHKAANFLVRDIDANGYFRSHGPQVLQNPVKTYTCLCAWSLYHAGEDLGHEQYFDAARRVGNAVLRQQHPNGWFSNNCLSARSDAPLLHTIGYTLQGLLELGIATGERRYMDSAARGVEGLLPHCERGFLHGRWFSDWQPASLWSCLTGSAQIAVVCYRIAEHTGESRYRRGADAVLNYLKALQPTSATEGQDDAEIVGGIGGSFPLIGAYMRNGLPGWATKFYLDALLYQHRFQVRDERARVAARPNATHSTQRKDARQGVFEAV